MSYKQRMKGFFFIESVLGFKQLENFGMARPTFKLIHQVNSGKGILVSLSLKTSHAQLHYSRAHGHEKVHKVMNIKGILLKQ